MLEPLLLAEFFAFLLIFCRIGSAIMLMPGFGDLYISPRVRLMFALSISLVLMPLLGASFPTMPESSWLMGKLIFTEILIGVFIGSLCRILLSAAHTAGQVVAMQSSLATATLLDLNQTTQATVISNFLTLAAIALMFTANLHHLMIKGLVSSYALFPIATLPPMEDVATIGTEFVSRAFMVATQLSAPVIIVGLLMYLGAGVLSRLMPSIQIFFIMLPAQIFVVFFVLMVTVAGMLYWYGNFFEDALNSLFIR